MDEFEILEGMPDLVAVLEGMPDLVAGCRDAELGQLLGRHDYPHLIVSAKRAVALEGIEYAELLHRVAGDLQELFREIWELAEAKGVPFHAHDLNKVAAFLAGDPKATDLRETAYNLLGSAAIILSLKLIYRVATLRLAV